MSMDIKTAVRGHLRTNDSAQKPIDWDEIVLRLETDVVAAPPTIPHRGRQALAVAAGVLLVALLGLITFFLPESDDTPPATDPVSPSTTVAPTTTTPATEEDAAEPVLPVVGDDEIVFAMAQNFPLIPDPEFSSTDGPDEASGQTARLWLVGETTDPAVEENYRDFSVSFAAFENEQLASEFIEDMVAQDPTMPSPSLTLETFIYPDLGDEAAATVDHRCSRGCASVTSVAVRRGRFVAQVTSEIDLDLDAETVDALISPDTAESTLDGFDAADYPIIGESVERLAGVAETADKTMQAVLTSDIQPQPAPRPETLTSYEMNVEVSRDDQDPRWVNSIVTPGGYGCEFVQNDEAQPGVAEIGDEAFEQIDWNEGWFLSTPDRPDFRILKDLCQTWSPKLEGSYIGDLTKLHDGHIGITNGRHTLSYWFTEDDLIEAGVVTASDNIEISDFRMIVDRAGPWLVSLGFDLRGDAEAVRRLVLLDIPDLETTHSFSISIGYGIIDDGTETWADRLDAWIQPRP